jgi:uncharacterized protein YlxP (DUF503 family)
MPESGSLKDKRQVVRSVAQRLRNTFHVAVAEVADNDAWQVATLGVACVSNSAVHCEQILREVVDYVESSRLDAKVTDIETDVIVF